MGFFKKIAALFSAGGARGGDEDPAYVHREYMRCSRCGELLTVRVDVRNELSPQYDSEGDVSGTYYVRKGVVGSGKTHCFQLLEVELYFDASRRLSSRHVSGGAFITRDEFDAGQA